MERVSGELAWRCRRWLLLSRPRADKPACPSHRRSSPRRSSKLGEKRRLALARDDGAITKNVLGVAALRSKAGMQIAAAGVVAAASVEVAADLDGRLARQQWLPKWSCEAQEAATMRHASVSEDWASRRSWRGDGLHEHIERARHHAVARPTASALGAMKLVVDGHDREAEHTSNVCVVAHVVGPIGSAVVGDEGELVVHVESRLDPGHEVADLAVVGRARGVDKQAAILDREGVGQSRGGGRRARKQELEINVPTFGEVAEVGVGEHGGRLCWTNKTGGAVARRDSAVLGVARRPRALAANALTDKRLIANSAAWTVHAAAREGGMAAAAGGDGLHWKERIGHWPLKLALLKPSKLDLALGGKGWQCSGRVKRARNAGGKDRSGQRMTIGGARTATVG